MYDLLEGPLSSSRRLGILGGALTLNVLFMTESTDHPREDQVAEVADRRPVPPFLGECELGHTTESQTAPFCLGFCGVSQLTFSQERGHWSSICHLCHLIFARVVR